jgi:threonine synthase
VGIVTSVRRIGADGAFEPATVPRLEAGDDGQFGFEYAYGPELLPAGAYTAHDMWRYRALLPIEEGTIQYPLLVGGTPLVAPAFLRERLRLPGLWLKDETRGPSGSNKDRGTGLVLEQALRTGVRTVSCASTGNVAASLAIGAAAAGVKAVLFVPANVNTTKLALMLYAGATVMRIVEGYGAAFELSRQAAQAFGWLDRNTGINPSTVEAKKTAAFEIWEQLGRRVPDVVFVPVGDGVTLWAMTKAFGELQACGATGGVPRIIGVQAEGCDPLYRAWQTGLAPAQVEPNTIADGIAVGEPLFGAAAIQAVRMSAGDILAVSDGDILEAARLLGRSAGIIAEPAGAAAMAGLVAARRLRLVDDAETVVVHVTGSGLKMPQFLRTEAIPPAIHASLDEAEWLLRGAS